jgi:hypothetical protein
MFIFILPGDKSLCCSGAEGSPHRNGPDQLVFAYFLGGTAQDKGAVRVV